MWYSSSGPDLLVNTFIIAQKNSYLNKPLLELIYSLNLGKNPSEPNHDCREQEQPEHQENFREVAARQISNLTWYLSDSAFRHEPNCHLYHSDPKFRIPFDKKKLGKANFYILHIFILLTESNNQFQNTKTDFSQYLIGEKIRIHSFGIGCWI